MCRALAGAAYDVFPCWRSLRHGELYYLSDYRAARPHGPSLPKAAAEAIRLQGPGNSSAQRRIALETELEKRAKTGIASARKTWRH